MRARSSQRTQQLLQVVAPDPCVGKALEWAAQQLDNALADAPFGPEAVWTACALLALGDFATVRSVIAFLGAKQGPRGSVRLEGTNSDSAGYDAADSTAAYLLLVARYHAASGNLGFVRAQWPQVRAALDYCRSNKADGADVTEDSPAGQDSIEPAPLSGAGAALCNAGVWAAAVTELALTAEAIGERADCDRLRADATRARSSLIDDAMLAVPLLLGVSEPSRMKRWLDLSAGHACTTPLAAGWTSWAAYTAGRTAAGFRHWRQNLLLGSERDGPEQAWSATMAIAPLVFGLLGFEPDAAKHRARLRPAIPPEWDALDVHNLRVGDCTLSLSYARADTVHSFRLSPTSGAVPLRLVFEPAVVAHEISSISIDGLAAALDIRAWGDRLLCPIQIVLDHDREVVIRTGPL